MLLSSGETQMIHKHRRLLPRQPQSLFNDLIHSVSRKQHLVVNRLQKSGYTWKSWIWNDREQNVGSVSQEIQPLM